MKKIKIILLLVILSMSSFAQVEQHAHWKFTVKNITNKEATLVFKAKIDKKWHIYGVNDEMNPITFTYNKSSDFETVGKVIQKGHPHKQYDDLMMANREEFSSEAIFEQKIKIKTNKDFTIKGILDYQACLDDGMCVMESPDFEFNIKLPSKQVSEKTEQTSTETKEDIQKEEPINNIEEKAENKESVENETKADASSIANTEGAEPSENKQIKADEENTENATVPQKSSHGLWWFFGIAFLSGLAAILTPCVFPMIPMTVSFFMHSSESKLKARLNAIFYGISIILIYTVIGTIIALTLGANFANWLSTHWIPNLFFFLIFLIFAFSFFGMFEITLPGWMVNKTDKQADKGGLFGAFFMAFTLVLVSFSCTGPIVGAILVESASGAEVLKPIIGMLGFSLAFALPFTLFALFPRLLKSMPKSGGWLNSVKVVLGFIELALGLKFLSIADQTYHWGILDREIYLAFWIVIFTLMGFYLLGKLKFAHDSDVKTISVPRLMFAIATFTFVVYMIPGMFGAPLKMLSGYLPPTPTQDFDINSIVRENVEGISYNNTGDNHKENDCGKVKYGDFLHLPHGIHGYFDYKQAIECSKKQNKPIFIDFTGHGCVNCREMEASVWSDPQVLKRLKNDYVVVALYVDDKKELPESEWYTSKRDNRVKKTIGKQNADFQITKYGINAQPYYVLIDSEGNMLTEPRAYDKDVDAFIKFLDEGIKNFHKKDK